MYTRRSFIGKVISAGAASTLVAGRPSILEAAQESALEVGEGVVDTTPPVGIEMAGFHRPLGEERRIEAIRQPTAARALLLRLGDVQSAIVSLDICGVSTEMTRRSPAADRSAMWNSGCQHPPLCDPHPFDAHISVFPPMGCDLARVHGIG